MEGTSVRRSHIHKYTCCARASARAGRGFAFTCVVYAMTRPVPWHTYIHLGRPGTQGLNSHPYYARNDSVVPMMSSTHPSEGGADDPSPIPRTVPTASRDSIQIYVLFFLFFVFFSYLEEDAFGMTGGIYYKNERETETLIITNFSISFYLHIDFNVYVFGCS